MEKTTRGPGRAILSTMRLNVEVEREEDGRWLAEVPDLAGVMAYGSTREQALAAVEALALRVIADRLEHGEAAPQPLELAFIAA
jgi:predicted RNase H-like HicB family nuclease